MNQLRLRYYQLECIAALYAYLRNNPADQYPIACMATGTGKSLTMAAFIAQYLRDCPQGRVIVLSHVQELIEQDAKAILAYWPEAPVSIWSAGLGVKRKGQITVASIQSIHKDCARFSPTDLVLIDECHLLSKNSNTMYRRFLSGLLKHNSQMRIVGFTATPYRLDSGLLTVGKDRLFTDIAYDLNVGRMISEGFLTPLISKAGQTKADLSGLHTRGGEWVPAELADRMDKVHLIRGAVEECMSYGQDRKSWLLFCSGVAHAQHVADCLNEYGIPAAMVCGETPKAERARILADFKAGRLRAVTNSDCLTTGFDHPGIDLIALLRPTKSIGLYMQIMGRGLRPMFAPGYDLDLEEGRLAALAAGPKPNCLVLDFTDTCERLGPIDAIKIKDKGAPGEAGLSVAPAKECPNCHSLIHASIMVCPECNYEWPARPKHEAVAGDAPLLSSQRAPKTWNVTGATYAAHSKIGGSTSLRATYQCGDMHTVVEYVPVEDPRPGVRKHAVNWFWKRGLIAPATVARALEMTIPTPTTITTLPDGKYQKVTSCTIQHK